MDTKRKKKMIKKYWTLAKEYVKDYITTNWNSNSIFNKGKVIFIGLVAFFLIWKLLYAIFV